MINTKYPLLFPLILAIFAGFIRVWNLSILNSLDYSNLLTSNLIIILFASLIVLFIVKSRVTYKKINTCDFLDSFKFTSKRSKTIQVVSAFLMLVSGIYLIYYSIQYNNDIVSIVLGVFTFFCGLSLLFIIKCTSTQKITSPFIFTIPMFLACFDLSIIFKENGANPIIFYYVYDLFTAIAIMYAFYFFSSFLFRDGRPATFIATSTLAISIIAFTLVSRFAYPMIIESAPALTIYEIIRYISFIASGLFLIVANINIVKNLYISNSPDDSKLI